MSPHALSVSPNGGYHSRRTSQHPPSRDEIPTLIDPSDSLLHRADDEELHDLICVGFGPASLAIAVALHDAIDSRDRSLSSSSPKVRFLERQDGFAWHAGMLLPGAKMQITFIKDLATLRNPRSEFTFLNYLHREGRLVDFTNLATFLPQRIEYEDYMRWCANHFEALVDYSQDVQIVEAASRDSRTGAIDSFQVTSSNRRTGQTSKLRARHVVIAAGGRPNIPKCLSAKHPRVIHSSQYATQIGKIFPAGSPPPKRVAIVGAGQSAAEVFHNIPSRFPGTQSVLLIRGAALRPSDDSPFVNEIFDPDRVDDIFSQESQLRADALSLDRATNYGVVRLELLEEIYSEMYSYKVQRKPEETWPHRILTHRNVTGMSGSTDTDDQPAIQLKIENKSGSYHLGKHASTETLDVDLVVIASGYARDSHESMLHSLRGAMPGGDVAGKRWSVQRNYGVEFEDGAVDANAGVWLQGCNEATHGLADSLLSILAVRGGEMVHNIFGTKDGRVVNGKEAR